MSKLNVKAHAKTPKFPGFFPVSVSELAFTIGYCEFKVPLFALGIRDTPSVFMKKGAIIHKSLEKQEEKEQQFEQLQIPEIRKLIEFGQTIDFKMESMKGHLIHNNFVYSGRMDKIQNASKKGFEVIEIKSSRNEDKRVFESYLIQSMAYAFMASKSLGISVDKGAITIKKASQTTGKIFHTVRISVSGELCHWFYQKLEKFENLFLGKQVPAYHRHLNKCLACSPSFRQRCEKAKESGLHSQRAVYNMF